jgi:hypothetical protein
LKKLYILSILLIIIIVTTNVYGHVTSGLLVSRPVRIEDEDFSAQETTVGNFVVITGKLVHLYPDKEHKLSPYILVDYSPAKDSFLADLNRFLYDYYPLYKNPASWYFKIESNLPNPTILKPNEKRDFEIKIYPLKAGTYHVHSMFFTDIGGYWGPGMTIIVTGSDAPTLGEITQLYLPFIFGVASATLLSLKARNVMRHGIRNSIIRLYFLIKSSVETIWLSGLILWFGFTGLSIYSYEEYTVMLSLTIFLISITILGYASAIARSKHKWFVISASIASIVFYTTLYFDHNEPMIYGFVPSELYPNTFLAFIATLISLAIAIYMAIWGRKDKLIKQVS